MANEKEKKLIQLIHIGKAELGMPDDAYLALLRGVCKKESTTLMSERELRTVLRRLVKAGFVIKPKTKKKAPANTTDANTKHQFEVTKLDKGQATLQQLRYIKDMWYLCSREKTEHSLRSFVRRVTGVDALRFLNVERAQKVILALRDMMEQAGLDPDSGKAPKGDAA